MPVHFRLRTTFALVGSLTLLTIARSSTAAPGDLDSTFDGDGKVTTNFGSNSEAGSSLAVQDDGKILTAGHVQSVGNGLDFALTRHSMDGSMDLTFDGDGKVLTDFFGNTDIASDIAFQDGKIVVAGSAYHPSLARQDFALARYDLDGTLDLTFGDGDGRVTTNFFDHDSSALGVVILSDGRIAAAGQSVDLGSGVFAVALYRPDGSLDETFDSDGRLITDVGPGNDQGNEIAIQGDGKMVVAGATNTSQGADFAVARYNLDGSLDENFDGDGKVVTDLFGADNHGFAVATDQSGRVVVAGLIGPSGSDFALARYNSNGSLDTSFHGDGKLTTDFGWGDDYAFGVLIQFDGKIVAAGQATVSGGVDFGVARYLVDGTLDNSFGGDGKVTTDFSFGFDYASGVALQDDGKIVAGGVAYTFGSDDLALARYDADNADLSITKTGPAGRAPTGRNMTYTLTVTNNGPDSASAVTVTDQLPSRVTFGSATAAQGSCEELNGTVFCTLGAMSSGAIVTIEIVVTPTTAGMNTNSASVASPTPDSNQGNNADSEDTSICRITSRRSSIPCG